MGLLGPAAVKTSTPWTAAVVSLVLISACAEDSPPASRDGTSTTTTVGSGSDTAAATRTDAAAATTTLGTASTQGTTPATTADQPAPDTTNAETRATVPGEYDLGAFTGTDIWVDPNAGDDANDGHDRVSAMRTVDAAWRMIPVRTATRRSAIGCGSWPARIRRKHR